MRIIIYGAGGIGSVIGGYLRDAGNEVVLIGRAGHVNAINKSGLKLITPAGAHYLQIPAVTDPDQIKFTPEDVVFLSVKSQNTEEALGNLKAIIKDIPVFCFQNGVRNEEIASHYFPRVYGATFGIGTEYLTDGEVYCRREPPGRILLGRYPRGTDELAYETAKKLTASSFFVKVTPDVMPYKWGKLMANLANAVDAITNSGGRDIHLIVQTAQQELTGLLELAGIQWISQEQLASETPEVKMPPRPSAGKPMHSSTWQSLTRQQGTVETEFLNGEVVRLAQKLNRNAPVNEKLTQIVRDMAANHDKPGKYSPDQLRSLLGLDG